MAGNQKQSINGVYSRKKKDTINNQSIADDNGITNGNKTYSNSSLYHAKGVDTMNGSNFPANGKKISGGKMTMNQKGGIGVGGFLENASFMKWGIDDAIWVLKYHRLPCVFACSLLFFMGVEYTLLMIPASSPPFDLGFAATVWLNRFLAASPPLNTLCAALNTVFVGMQTAYIVWVFLVEGRARPGIASLFMFTCRGILGYSTQLPLPEDFLGSGADFPVGNVSFFLFYSGHVASAVIGSLDMRRMRRKEMAWMFDILNILQIVRLLGTRGHYTIDLAVGIGSGFLFDSLAGKYVEDKKIETRLGSPING